MPNDVLNAWKHFLDRMEAEHGHRKALLIMHTDPTDNEGPNLLAVSDVLGLKGNVAFSNQKLEFHDMNVLYNIADCCINISKAEGFGLSTLISMQVGRPIVASYTGGHIRQLVNPETGFVHGISVKPAARSLVGSQMVPYIYDDHINYMDVGNGLMELYNMGAEKRAEIGQKAKEYVASEFSYEKMISEWDRTLDACIKDFKSKQGKGRWSLSRLQSYSSEKILPPSKQQNVPDSKAGTQLMPSEKQMDEATSPLNLSNIVGLSSRKQLKVKR
jgi:glycosyltransferase involved in cell wall biosynthesis